MTKVFLLAALVALAVASGCQPPTANVRSGTLQIDGFPPFSNVHSIPSNLPFEVSWTTSEPAAINPPTPYNQAWLGLYENGTSPRDQGNSGASYVCGEIRLATGTFDDNYRSGSVMFPPLDRTRKSYRTKYELFERPGTNEKNPPGRYTLFLLPSSGDQYLPGDVGHRNYRAVAEIEIEFTAPIVPVRVGPLPDESTLKQHLEQIVGQADLKETLQLLAKRGAINAVRQANNMVHHRHFGHFAIMGPPGTGKTKVSKSLHELLQLYGMANSKSVYISNGLELLAKYVGHTKEKVDQHVAEAAGGVLILDEAYSLTKDQTFGPQAIDALMAHMEPPSTTFIFLGQADLMNSFFSSNPGLQRRIQHRLFTKSFSDLELLAVLEIQANKAGELLAGGARVAVLLHLRNIPENMKALQNGGLTATWLQLAQIERDSSLDMETAKRQPALTAILEKKHFDASLKKLMNNQ